MRKARYSPKTFEKLPNFRRFHPSILPRGVKLQMGGGQGRFSKKPKQRSRQNFYRLTDPLAKQKPNFFRFTSTHLFIFEKSRFFGLAIFSNLGLACTHKTGEQFPLTLFLLLIKSKAWFSLREQETPFFFDLDPTIFKYLTNTNIIKNYGRFFTFVLLQPKRSLSLAPFILSKIFSKRLGKKRILKGLPK